MDSERKKLIVVCGPTASGKSDLYEQLKEKSNKPIECINADTGQMYKGLEVGTAKPDLQTLTSPENYHLFDMLELGELFSAGKFRALVARQCEQIWARGHQPVIVGGSMFYIFALFFPPQDPAKNEKSGPEGIEQTSLLAEKKKLREESSTQSLYEELKSLDPERAEQIMPGDRFRVIRALEIWDKHGVLPSKLSPEFKPLGQTDLVFVCPEREVLDERIAKRLKIMINGKGLKTSWIDEAQKLHGDEKIRNFISSSRLIGYKQILSWIDRGRKPQELDELERELYFATRTYSRNQIKFWKSLERKIKQADKSGLTKIINITGPEGDDLSFSR